MFTTKQLFAQVSDGVICISFLDANKALVGKGTGFLCAEYLITNSHVASMAAKNTVEMVWLRQDSHSVRDLKEGLLISAASFLAAIATGSDPDKHDYSVIKLPVIDSWKGHRFELKEPKDMQVGTAVAFMGYPLEHMNLCCHGGMIASFYTTGNTEVIQLDASVNHANSGGPLLDLADGKVCGIITRKATGLSKIFDELKTALKRNIQVIQQARSGASMRIGGVDPMEAIEASQHQMQNVLGELERSSNVGIGYAFSSSHILRDPLFEG
ncbi:MAG: trypsin-like peptidase domain-containing protein [Proteobacteria bacterium]|nr:trypsin-like peptidase domain-containing protein [Pseudomonadota bacterium]